MHGFHLLNDKTGVFVQNKQLIFSSEQVTVEYKEQRLAQRAESVSLLRV